MNIRFTEEARSRLREIHAFIAQDSPQNATAVIARIIARAQSLRLFHLRGRNVPEFQSEFVREIPEGPFRIIYRVNSESVEILTVMHRRQLLPDDIPSKRR